MKVLVTGASGNQGKLLVPKLAAAGHSVRAARLSPGKDDALKRLGADEVFVGDLTKLDVYVEALAGCDAVYHVGATGVEGETAGGLAMIEAAKRCGTRHVVFSSVYHTIIDIVQHRYKRDVEEMLFESGLNYTVLRPCDYMLPDYYVDVPLSTGTLPAVMKINDHRYGSLIALADLTDAAFKVLNEGSKHYAANYELAGPDKLTQRSIATILSRVLGRDIKLVQSSPDEYVNSVFGITGPTPESEHARMVFRSIAKYYDTKNFIGNPNVLEWLLGRPATSFEQFVRATLAERRAIDA